MKTDVKTSRTADHIGSVSCCRRVGFRAAAPVLAAGAALFFAGCGGADQVQVYPVSGKIKFGKEVPVGAQVVLHPEGHSLPGDAIPVGTVAEDGSFKVGTYASADGAPAGDYKATVQWFKVVTGPGGTGRGPNVLPPTYSDPAKSPIKIAVAEGNNDLNPIEIVKK